MAKYVNLDNVIEQLEIQWGYEGMREELYALPAADVEPVRHGRWEWLGPNELARGCMCGTCSACKVRSKYIVNTDICPNCGADMRGATILYRMEEEANE